MTGEHTTPVVPFSEDVLGEILESVNDAVVAADDGHEVVYMNRAAELMFGFPRGEVLGRDLSMLIPQPYREHHREYVERYLATRVPRVIGKTREFTIDRPDGTKLPIEISYSVSERGGRTLFTAVIRDITRRRELEQQVRFSERLADVGKAVTQVVHEIRKPLMLIGGFARQLQSSVCVSQDEKSSHKLGIIVEEVRRLEKLLNGIRLLTRPTVSGEKTVVEVNALVQETVDLLEPLLQNQDVVVETDLALGNFETLGDPDQLKQVFLNILQNALDAMKGHGHLKVSTRLRGAVIRVAIEDDGPGIPADLLERVFDPFFTTKPEGTGLGLAISKNIVQDCGGTLAVVCPVGGGTAVMIDLPLDSAASAAAATH